MANIFLTVSGAAKEIHSFFLFENLTEVINTCIPPFDL